MKAVLLCLFLMTQAPSVLFLSTTEALPAQVVEATSTGENLELRAPSGFVVEGPWMEAGLTHWRLSAGRGVKPSLQPYRIELWQGSTLVDTVGLRICCQPWPAALKVRAWLPFVQ